MRWLSRLFAGRPRVETDSLDRFIEQIHYGENLTVEQSMRNIEDGVVEIVCHEQHSSNGILITRNGYFLTANHCIDDSLTKKRARLYNGQEYEIQRVCAVSKNRDIALAKIDLPGEPEPQEYRFYNTNLLVRTPVVLLARWDGRIERNYGVIDRFFHNVRVLDSDGRNEEHFVNHFLMSHWSGRPGYSGGPICSPDGRLIGISSTGEQFKCGTGCKLLDALELVHFYKRNVKKH